MYMSRAAAIAAAERYFDDGGFATDLGRRVAIPTESQVEGSLPVLNAYLSDEIAPSLAKLGFRSEVIDNPVRGGPMLIAERREEGAATTVFGYGHGDVIRGLEPQWRRGPVAVGATAGRRTALRTRHRRQQGAAFNQHGGARLRPEDAREARVQHRAPVRDR